MASDHSTPETANGNVITKRFPIVIDQQPYEWFPPTITAEELRHLASLPAADTVDLFHKVPGKGDIAVLPGSTVDLTEVIGPDHFSSAAVGARSGDGRFLLLPTDYATLLSNGVQHSEDADQRILILKSFPLPPGLYKQERVDVLIKIPPGYGDQGIDMFWTCPRLELLSGQAINATMDIGSSENIQWEGREYTRWSRHWNGYGDTPWRPGLDAIHTILSRVRWCLANPNGTL